MNDRSWPTAEVPLVTIDDRNRCNAADGLKVVGCYPKKHP